MASRGDGAQMSWLIWYVGRYIVVSGSLQAQVIFCTVRPGLSALSLMDQMTSSSLLTFRRPTSADVQRSPLRYVVACQRRCNRQI